MNYTSMLGTIAWYTGNAKWGRTYMRLPQRKPVAVQALRTLRHMKITRPYVHR